MLDLSQEILDSGLTTDIFLRFANYYSADAFLFALSLYFIVGMVSKHEKQITSIIMLLIVSLFATDIIPKELSYILILVSAVVIAKVFFKLVQNKETQYN